MVSFSVIFENFSGISISGRKKLSGTFMTENIPHTPKNHKYPENLDETIRVHIWSREVSTMYLESEIRKIVNLGNSFQHKTFQLNHLPCQKKGFENNFQAKTFQLHDLSNFNHAVM